MRPFESMMKPDPMPPVGTPKRPIWLPVVD
jgi:hypothetical protein